MTISRMITFSWWKKSEEALSAFEVETFDAGEEGVPFFRNRLVRAMLIFSGILFIISVGVLGWRIGKTDLPVILHYNAYFGVDLFGAWWQVYILPVFSLFFLAVNLLLARKFYMLKERIASHILLFAAFFAGLVSAIASLAVAFVNS